MTRFARNTLTRCAPVAALTACTMHPMDGRDAGEDAMRPDAVDAVVAPADWSCLGRRRIATDAGAALTLRFSDAVTHAPVTGLSLALCAAGRVQDCVAGSADAVASGATDGQGTVALAVARFDSPDGFIGYAHAVDASHTVLENTIYVDFVADRSLPVDAPTAADLAQWSTTLGTTVDLATHGMVLGRVTDCADQPAAGATVSLDATSDRTRVFYFVGSAPDATARATDASGGYVIVNAEPATLVVHVANASGASVSGSTVAPAVGTVLTVLTQPSS